MKLVKALNNYFFDEDTITATDGLWFYGITGLVLIAGVGVWLV